MPTRFSVSRSTKLSRFANAALIAVILALLLAPWWSTRGMVGLLTEFLYFLALAQLWNLLAGYAGVVSLGQQAYIGLGGYTVFVLAGIWNTKPLVALLLAGIVGVCLAIPVAALVFRLRGAHLAIGTWVVAEVFRLGFSQISALGAGSGKSLPVSVAQALDVQPLGREGLLYLIALILAIFSNVGSYWLLRSPQGLALTAIRDNEATARSCGVDSRRLRLMVFLGTALGATLVGGLIFLTKFRISPSAAFDINWTSYVIFIVVIGGIGTLEGPLVGTALFFLLRESLAGFGAWYLIVLGCVAIVVMLKSPAGIWGAISRKYDISLFPIRRVLTVSQKG